MRMAQLLSMQTFGEAGFYFKTVKTVRLLSLTVTAVIMFLFYFYNINLLAAIINVIPGFAVIKPTVIKANYNN